MKSICVFAGSRYGEDEQYRTQAGNLGAIMAERGCRLIYGGSRHGLMGAVADAVLGAGGEVVGVMPSGLIHGEKAHPGLTQFIEVVDMHTRKATMSQLADGFIALPGGFGTLEELFEVLCWLQIGIHQKPVGVLNVKGYYDPLIQLVESCVNAGFVQAEQRSLLSRAEEPGELLHLMESFIPSITEAKWRQQQ